MNKGFFFSSNLHFLPFSSASILLLWIRLLCLLNKYWSDSEGTSKRTAESGGYSSREGTCLNYLPSHSSDAGGMGIVGEKIVCWGKKHEREDGFIMIHRRVKGFPKDPSLWNTCTNVCMFLLQLHLWGHILAK